ncbi:uncharacterized protein LOC132748697 isoform X2 [Ruditapes philippinarum]|nr:uncharacterized protein LOC132748697 isoform X2 [Ruditapes philippinarum]
MAHNISDCFDNVAINDVSVYKGSKQFGTKSLTHFEENESVALTIHQTTFDDSGLYSCVYNSTIYSSVNISVGESPRAPTDLFCITYNFTALKCYFKLFETNIPTDTEMKFKRNWHNWTTLRRSNCNIAEGTCWLDSENDEPSEYTFLPNVEYEICVETRNKLGENSSYIKIENTYNIVKPAPVGSVHFTEVTGTSVELHWVCPKGLSYKDDVQIDYRITVTSDLHQEDYYKLNSSSVDEHMVITGLKPSTNYTVTVQAKPSAATRDIYWSNISTIVSFVTNSTGIQKLDVKFAAVAEVTGATVSVVVVCCLVVVLAFYGRRKYTVFKDRNRIATPDEHNDEIGTDIIEPEDDQENISDSGYFLSFAGKRSTSSDSTEKLLKKNVNNNHSNNTTINSNCILSKKVGHQLTKNENDCIKACDDKICNDNVHLVTRERNSVLIPGLNIENNVSALPEEEKKDLIPGINVQEFVSVLPGEENNVLRTEQNIQDYVFTMPGEENNVLILGNDVHDYVSTMPGEENNVLIPGNGVHDYVTAMPGEENNVPILGNDVHDYVSTMPGEENNVSIPGNDVQDYVSALPEQEDDVLMPGHNVQDYVFDIPEENNVLIPGNYVHDYVSAMPGEENDVLIPGNNVQDEYVSTMSVIENNISTPKTYVQDYLCNLQEGENSSFMPGHDIQDYLLAVPEEEKKSKHNVHNYVSAVSEEENNLLTPGHNVHDYEFALPEEENVLIPGHNKHEYVSAMSEEENDILIPENNVHDYVTAMTKEENNLLLPEHMVNDYVSAIPEESYLM